MTSNLYLTLLILILLTELMTWWEMCEVGNKKLDINDKNSLIQWVESVFFKPQNTLNSANMGFNA